jgi:hypothetical protein
MDVSKSQAARAAPPRRPVRVSPRREKWYGQMPGKPKTMIVRLGVTQDAQQLYGDADCVQMARNILNKMGNDEFELQTVQAKADEVNLLIFEEGAVVIILMSIKGGINPWKQKRKKGTNKYKVVYEKVDQWFEITPKPIIEPTD